MLIVEVEKRPILYDKDRQGFKDTWEKEKFVGGNEAPFTSWWYSP